MKKIMNNIKGILKRSKKGFLTFLALVVCYFVAFIIIYFMHKSFCNGLFTQRDNAKDIDTRFQKQEEFVEVSDITYGALGSWLDGYQYRICYRDMFDFTKDGYKCIYFNTVNTEDLYLSSDLDWDLIGNCKLKIEGSHCIFISNNDDVKSFRTQDFYIQERND